MNQFDFQLDEQMSPVVGLLHAMVDYNYRRLLSLVKDLSQEQIDYRGEHDDLNSIAQHIRHLSVVDLHCVYRLRFSEMPENFKKRFGPMYDAKGRLPLVQNIQLDNLLEDYEEVQQLFRDTCMQLRDQDLEKLVTFGNENEKTATVRWGIWHIADHSSLEKAMYGFTTYGECAGFVVVHEALHVGKMEEMLRVIRHRF